jgi:hypothetical protein
MCIGSALCVQVCEYVNELTAILKILLCGEPTAYIHAYTYMCTKVQFTWARDYSIHEADTVNA